MKKLLILIIIPLLSFGQSICLDNLACNFNEPEPCDFYSCIDCLNYPIPDVYDFEIDGMSTVDYSSCRLEMAVELYSALGEPSLTAESLLDMFYGGIGFSNNISSECEGESIAAHTSSSPGASVIAGQQIYDMIAEQVETVFPYVMFPATPGESGVIYDSNGYPRFVNNKGLEIKEVFVKALSGALCLDRITNIYTNPSYISPFDNDEWVDPELYTEMEHIWDLGFGYLYGMDDQINPSLLEGVLLNKLLGQVNNVQFPGIGDAIYEAFIVGRAAISNNDYETRNLQSDIIKSLLGKVIAQKTVDYLLAAADIINSGADLEYSFGYFSAAYGLIFALQYTSEISSGQSNAWMDDLLMTDYGFWSVSVDDINNIVSSIYEYIDLSTYYYDNTALSDLSNCTGLDIDKESINKNLITTVDLLGREATNKGFQLHIYNDGSVEKKYLIK